MYIVAIVQALDNSRLEAKETNNAHFVKCINELLDVMDMDG